jgi:hypothetical protein
VEKTAREKLQMRTATPAVTQYVNDAAAGRVRGGRDEAGFGSPARARRRPPACAASTTPPARCWPARRRPGARASSSRWSAWPSWAWSGRAVYIQIIGTDFYQKEGEKRFAHTLEVPASRGRVLDRNGLVLATSVPSPSLWAIPKDFQADTAQRRQLARLLGMPAAELEERLGRSRNFAWLARQVDEPVWDQVKALNIKGVYQQREYKRKYPEGEAAAHVVGFTNVEETGQEGIELRFDDALRAPTARAPWCATAWAAWSRTWATRSTR